MKDYSCKDCPDRYVTDHSNCHATCEKYLKASRERREELDRVKKIKDTARDITEVTRDYDRTNRFRK